MFHLFLVIVISDNGLSFFSDIYFSSLTDGIKNSPDNWQHCSMLTQDIIDADLNVTAEVTEYEAEMFQNMCKTFTVKVFCDELAELAFN